MERSDSERVAELARERGIGDSLGELRRTIPPFAHLGALMADAVLQAGLNYASVVRPRVERIMADPATRHLDGVMRVVRGGRTGRFLEWSHHEKIGRFDGLANHFDRNWIGSVEILRERMGESGFRDGLLSLRGIGPKTRDYIGALCGRNDVIAVDRHIVSFADQAGVGGGYDALASVFAEAAGILGIPPRNFDSWVWRSERGRKAPRRG